MEQGGNKICNKISIKIILILLFLTLFHVCSTILFLDFSQQKFAACHTI